MVPLKFASGDVVAIRLCDVTCLYPSNVSHLSKVSHLQGFAQFLLLFVIIATHTRSWSFRPPFKCDHLGTTCGLDVASRLEHPQVIALVMRAKRRAPRHSDVICRNGNMSSILFRMCCFASSSSSFDSP